MASVAGDFCSHIGEGSQAVPVAMSQVLRQYKRTRLNRAPQDDKEQSNIKIAISYHSFFCVCYVILIKQGHQRQFLENICSEDDLRSRIFGIFVVMHQSIPAAPSTPPGYCGAFARLVSPEGGAFANFELPGGRAFPNPGAIPDLLTRTRFAIRK